MQSFRIFIFKNGSNARQEPYSDLDSTPDPDLSLQFEKVLAERHDCKPVLHRVPYKWPFALDLLNVQFEAYYSGHSLEVLTSYITIAKTIRVGLWSVTGCIMTDPLNIETILSTRFDDYGIGTRTLALLPFLRERIFTQDGRAWKRSRDLIRLQFVAFRNSHRKTSHLTLAI